jgi:hypothetical protein
VRRRWARRREGTNQITLGGQISRLYPNSIGHDGDVGVASGLCGRWHTEVLCEREGIKYEREHIPLRYFSNASTFGIEVGMASNVCPPLPTLFLYPMPTSRAFFVVERPRVGML